MHQVPNGQGELGEVVQCFCFSILGSGLGASLASSDDAEGGVSYAVGVAGEVTQKPLRLADVTQKRLNVTLIEAKAEMFWF